jgi:hypothetical protein
MMKDTTTDFTIITDFILNQEGNDMNMAPFPVDENGHIYRHGEWNYITNAFEDDDRNQLLHVRIINCSIIPLFAFSACNNLKVVLMDDSVEEIDCHAFLECKALEHIKLSRNIQYIRFHAFNGCTSLSSIFIPETCQNIDIHSFISCSDLIILIISYKTHVLNSIVKGCNKLIPYSSFDDNQTQQVNDWIKNRFQYLPLHQLCCSTNSIIRSLTLYTCLQNLGHASGLDTDYNQMTALHILMSNPYVSGHDDAILGNYLKLCPQAGMALDKFGCTPFHYLVKKKHGFTVNMFEMYVKYCPEIQNNVKFEENIASVYFYENGTISKLEQEMIACLFHYFCPYSSLLGPIHLTESYLMHYSLDD